jgi:2',3'-cyclic-nucleotide 2'-phosphodiesterase (5'-nucleotidase family)
MMAMVAEIDRPYRAKLDEVLAISADRIGRQYKSESPFDVMVGDMLRAHSGAEVAFMPGVGYGVSIAPGTLTRERLYTLLPHPTKLVTLEMTGAQILGVLEQSATNLNPGNDLDRVGGLVQTSGMAWTLNLNDPLGSRVSDVTIGGAPIDRRRWYRVATNAGMTGGLHRYVFDKGRNSKTHVIGVTQLVENAIRSRRTLVSPAMGNIRLVPLITR